MRSRRLYQVIISLLFVFIFSGITTVSAKTLIEWSETPLELFVSEGTATSTHIELTSNIDLNNVTVSVVPELSPFITVFPDSFDTLAAGESRTVSLWVSAPANTLLSTYDGTIRVNQGARTLSMPLPVLVTVDTATIDTVPDTVALPSPDRIVADPLTGIDYVQNELVIDFEKETSLEDVKALVSSIGGVFLGSIPELNSYQVRVQELSIENLRLLAESIESEPIVRYATLHHLHDLFLEPNDLAFQDPDKVWGQRMINLPEAWDITTGSPCTSTSPVSVAVIDTGFMWSHDEFENFMSGTSNTDDSFFLLAEHGTKVAGVIGAEANNAEGLAGALWEGCIRLYPVGAFKLDYPSFTKIDALLSTQYAIEAMKQGARVINYSAGATSLTEEEAISSSIRWLATVEWSILNNKNTLFVFAAGNDPIDVRLISPANLVYEPPIRDNVVAIAAINSDGTLYEKSARGEGITVAAPGNEIYTTSALSNVQDYTETAEGTSLAAPFVSGVAGLMLSVNENLAAPDLKRLLEEGAKIGGNGVTTPDGDLIYTLNAYESVKQAMEERAKKFTIGDRVEVTALPGTSVLVFENPDGSGGGTQEAEALGTVIDGPVYLDSLDTWLWNVDFDEGADGWVAEEYLQQVQTIDICDVGNPIVPCENDGVTYDTFAGNYSQNRVFYKANSYEVSINDGYLLLSLKDGLPHTDGYAYVANYLSGTEVWTSPEPYNVTFYIFGQFNGASVKMADHFEWFGVGSAPLSSNELTPIRDIWTTSVYSYDVDNHFSGCGGGRDDEDLRVGGWGDYYYSLLQFDVSGIEQPVVSATLRLYNHVDASNTSNTVSMHLDRVTSDWDWTTNPLGDCTLDNERLWWADRPSYVTYASWLPAPARPGYWETDVTDLVNGHITGLYENFGMQLRPTSNSFEFNIFASSQHPEVEWRPKLILEFSNNQ